MTDKEKQERKELRVEIKSRKECEEMRDDG